MAVKKHELMPENNIGLLAHRLDISKVYMLSPSDLIAWCKSIVVLLSKIEIPSDASDRATFYIQVQEAEDYLKKMVNEIESNSRLKLLFGLLKQLYDIIANAGPSTCPAASIVLGLTPGMHISVPRFISAIVSNEDGGLIGSTAEKDAHLRTALTTLCTWLCYWEGTPSLHHCIISFMKALQELNKFDILLDVSMDVICDLFNALQFPSVRGVAIDVFLHILASTRDSVDVFNKIAHNVPDVLENLARDTSPESRSVLQNLVEAFTALLDLHPTHKEKYSDIVNCLDAHIKSNNCYIMDVRVWKKSSKKGKSSFKTFSKVGLINLGNTCYMNSALQALLMSKQFSNGIVMSNLKFPLMCKLKSLFAHMLFSEIPFVNPQDIFILSKPINFTRGAQQDSSEFICHLLDRLHEYESYCLSLKFNTSESSKENCELDDSLDCGNLLSSDISLPETSAPIDMTAVVPENPPITKTDDAAGRKRCNIENSLDGKRRCMRSEQNSSNPDSTTYRTIVQKVFAGVMSTSTQCLQCNFISCKKDAFWDLQLAFPDEPDKPEDYSITQLLQYYCSPENLVGDNKYNCQRCQSLQDAERSVSIDSAPRNLIVVLKHFFYEPKQRVRAKLFHNVRLDKQITIFEGRGIKKFYELYAVIIHSGANLDDGHYYTIGKDGPNNWYVFNDAEVRPCSEQAIYTLHGFCTPYIAFYKKLDISSEEELKKMMEEKEAKAKKAATGYKSEDNDSDDSSSETTPFNPADETIPMSFLPAYLAEQIKNSNMAHPYPKRSTRHKRPKYDDDQPGSSSQY